MTKKTIMKTSINISTTTILLLASFFIFINLSLAQEITYQDSWGKHGFSIVSQSSSGVEVNYSVNTFSITKSIINDRQTDVITIPGYVLPNNEGAPNLPGTGRFIAIPQGATASLQIVSVRTEIYKNIEQAPAPRILLQTETEPPEYVKDNSIFSSNKFYPEKPIIISESDKIRGVDIVMLGITPFQYNPVTKELLVYRDLKIDIKFEFGNGQFGDDRLRSRWWDPYYKNMLLNYRSLPEIDFNHTFKSSSKDEGAEYLIISPNGLVFQQWADSIRNFRTLQGISSKVVTLDEVGGSTASQIENYINNAYYSWDIPPVACLLLGDYGSDASSSIISPIWDGYCVSDNIYADVDGNDLPDIVIARMCAENASQLETMITKFLEYEKNPPVDNSYYNHPITSCQFQSGGWAQICTESVAGFYEVVQNKSTNRINVCNGTLPDEWSIAPNTAALVNYFGPNGLGYIPATPAEVNCTWNGNTTDVINGINDGAFMLLHRGTGSTQGWGEPDFSNSDINALNNSNLAFIWSVDCLTGKFNIAGDCFAEKFHRHTSGGNNAGALGIVAASEISYFSLNDVYAWGAFNNMWPDFLPDAITTPASNGVLPAFANVAAKYYLEQSSWPYNPNNKVVTYNIFHYFGDAFSTVYTKIPQELAVSHSSSLLPGATNFEVTANEGSLIALSVNGVLIGKAEGTGAPVFIEIPPQNPPDEILVTVTKQNYYRYEDWVTVGTGTGVNENPTHSLMNVYPNPASDKISIKLPDLQSVSQVIIYNQLGVPVFQKEFNQDFSGSIDVSNLLPGVYYISLSLENENVVSKLILVK